MLPVIPLWVHMAISVTLVAAAFWRGGGQERFAALYMLVTAAAAAGACRVTHCPFWVHILFVSPDVAVFIAMALRSDRYWPLWAAAVSCNRMMLILLQLAAPTSRWAFGTADLVWHYALVAAVLQGVCAAPRRRGDAPHVPLARERRRNVGPDVCSRA